MNRILSISPARVALFLSLILCITACKKEEVEPVQEDPVPTTGGSTYANITGTSWTPIASCPTVPDYRIKAMAVVEDKLLFTFLNSTNISGLYNGNSFSLGTQSPMDFWGGTGTEKIQFSNDVPYGLGFFNDNGLLSFDINAYWSWQGVASGMLYPVNSATHSLAELNDTKIVACASTPYVRTETPTDWYGLGNDFDYPVYDLINFNNTLIAAGGFTYSGGTPVNHVAQWNGTEWLPMGEGLNGTVRDLVEFDNTLIAIGSFTESGAGDPECSYIARWNGTTWEPIDGGIQGGNGARVGLVYGDQLFVAGDFSSASGISSQNVIKWTASGWEALPGISESVGEIAVYKDHLYATNHFDIPGGNFLVRLD